jgi:hypothetical protein
MQPRSRGLTGVAHEEAARPASCFTKGQRAVAPRPEVPLSSSRDTAEGLRERIERAVRMPESMRNYCVVLPDRIGR